MNMRLTFTTKESVTGTGPVRPAHYIPVCHRLAALGQEQIGEKMVKSDGFRLPFAPFFTGGNRLSSAERFVPSFRIPEKPGNPVTDWADPAI
jgi:hypothetical protein